MTTGRGRTESERNDHAGTTPLTRPADAATRARLGPYVVGQLLGRGGQACVYLAEDERSGRQVALKIIETDGSPRVLEMFRREITLARDLDHPNVCATLEAGVEGRSAWIAMEYVAGETLSQQLARARPPASDETVRVDPATRAPRGEAGTPVSREEIFARVKLIEKAARALQSCHDCHVIHRDIKPGNIIIREDGEPVILDFGLARQELEQGKTVTLTGELLGTPAYLSPEQLAAKRIRLDRRTDVYSLGATLYECLTLRVPFDAPTRDALYQAILWTEPPALRRVNPLVSKSLAVVVAKAMEKNRDRRYATAAALADDLAAILAGRPIAARPVGPLGRLERWARRAPAAAALVAVLLLALPTIAALVASRLANAPRLEQQRQLALEAEKDELVTAGGVALESGRVDEARRAFEAALAMEGGSPEAAVALAALHHRAGRFAEVLSLLDEQRPVVGGTAAAAVLRAEARQALGEDVIAAEEISAASPTSPLDHLLLGARELARGKKLPPGQAQPSLERAVELTRHAVASSPRPRLSWLAQYAHAAGHAGDAASGRIAARALERHWPASARALYWAGFAAASGDDFEEGARLYGRAAELDPSLAVARLNRALCLYYAGHEEEARAVARGPGEEAPAGFHRAIATHLREQGRLRESAAEYERACALDPTDAAAHSSHGLVLIGLGRLDDATRACRRAVELEPESALYHFNLAGALRQSGRVDDAMDELEAAAAADPDFAVAYCNLGILWESRGEPKRAVESYRRAVLANPGLPIAWRNLGLALFRDGRHDEAVEPLRRAVELHPDDAALESVLARSLEGAGRRAEGLAVRRAAAARHERDAQMQDELGGALQERGQVEEAIERYRLALSLDPGRTDTALRLAGLLAQEGRLDEAITVARDAAARRPAGPDAWAAVGTFLSLADRHGEAVAPLRRAADLDPERPETLCNLALALARSGHVTEALPIIRRGHALGSKRADWSYPSAGWLAELEQLAETDALIAAAAAGDRPLPRGRDLARLAEDAATVGRFRAAARWFREAFAQDPAAASARGRRRPVAACAAVRVATAPDTGPADAVAWLRQARRWLEADLDEIEELVDDEQLPDDAADRWIAAWLADSGLRAVRDEPLSVLVPDEDAEMWRELWRRCRER